LLTPFSYQSDACRCQKSPESSSNQSWNYSATLPIKDLSLTSSSREPAQHSTLRKVDTPFAGRAVVQVIPQSLGADATANAGHDLATILCCIDLPKAIAD